MAPSLCGNFVTNQRSLIAFTWTITCCTTIIAFITCTIYIIHIHTSYIRYEHSLYESWYYNYLQYISNQQQQEEGENGEQQQQHSADREYEAFTFNYNRVRSGSMTFTFLYVFLLAIAIILYGSTAIIGFTSLRGVYIAPCFSSVLYHPHLHRHHHLHNGSSMSSNNKTNTYVDPSTIFSLKLGIFGGAIILYANVLLICAVVFGEVRVEDWRNQQKDQHNDQQEQEQREMPYEIERIATVLAVTCMFLAALYSIFAILLFLFFGSKDTATMLMVDVDDIDVNDIVVMQAPPSTSVVNVGVSQHPVGISLVTDPRREKFITIQPPQHSNASANDIGVIGNPNQYDLS